MPLTFRKRIKIMPGLYINLGKTGVSVTTKVGPVSHTTGRRRSTTSVDLPGPLGYRKTRTKKNTEN
jgi:Protein of unknown function (DUF4236)